MTNNSTTSPALQSEAETTVHLLDDWFDAIEVGLRERVREFIQAMIESELETALARPRYGRRRTADTQNGDGSKGISGHRHGHRSRSLMGTFGRVEIAVPRARLESAAGKTTEWKSSALRAYQRRTQQADSLIASTYLAGTNTRRVGEGERRLGCLECPLVRRGADHPPDPGWHRGAGPARPQGHRDRAPGRARRARGRPESAVGRQEYGRRNQRGVARCSRRSRQARATQARVPDRRRRHWAGASTGRPLGRRADPTLHGPQAPQPAG